MRLVLTDRELAKLFVMLLLAALMFGITGLMGMLVMQWVTRQRYAKDEAAKHGISQVNASRLGGVVVIGLSLSFLFSRFLMGYEFDDIGPLGIQTWGWLVFLSTSLLGLIEDIDNDLLSPALRLALLVLFFGITFVIWPEIIPNNIGYQLMDNIMSQPIIGWALSVVFCVGFINAINMADGANGLVPGIVFIASVIFNSVMGAMIWEILSIVSGVFLLFNVISGRLFLGDAGAYGLGAILVLAGFYAVNTHRISVEFAAVMMCYPCVEVIMSMIRRRVSGRSMFKPDNHHLHNYIHEQLKTKTRSRVAANSFTGLIIACASTGVAFVGSSWGYLEATSSQWGWVFVAQVLVYLLSYWGLSRPVRQVVTQ
ncbi:undecaprenyl/decaprenyl-phosphate alpha-N-acetylglucosaminyl 1-phosphate transferase [Porticoccaceae bacterium]|jgi:UDP-GlcNAc:undecaprenyl-phosphate/decaprenyl-phosphate GlcNAc-1-phosphate transferase|nr:undecaprenyl/decaprenyl-phosphate alpha-N-acetylglucosaminyl 1-phosphate transferase [Porticoccaceae bacterium]MDA8898579.1 undecaprenyl/decaprenyl-phosphate alpha-N-acetylglucosaminyl 1-phosphate transferase [Porticoccaceae bacterium]